MSERIGAIVVGNDEVITDGDGGGDNSGNSAGNVIDPSAVEPPKRGRGRPKSTGGTDKSGSAGKPAGTVRASVAKVKTSPAVSVDALNFIINMIGGFVAAKTKQEALTLDDAESRVIAEAAANVAKHYNIPVNEKTAAWIGLATAVGTIYGAKIAVIKMNKSLQAK